MPDVQIQITGDGAVLDMLRELPESAQRKIITPLLREGSETFLSGLRSAAPEETGLTKKALGHTKVKVYQATLFATVGVRRGFRRAVGLSRGSVKRLRGARASSAMPEDFRNPTKYLHLITGGRKEVHTQTAKVLYSAQAQKFFGKHAAAVQPRPFVSETFDRTAMGVVGRITQQAPDLIVAEAVRLGGQKTRS